MPAGWFRGDIAPKMICTKRNRLDPWSTGCACVLTGVVGHPEKRWLTNST